MNKIMKFIGGLIIAVLACVAVDAQAQGVYERYTGVSSAVGAKTFTYAGDYSAYLIKAITVKGAGITNSCVVSKVTKDNVNTQTVATVVGTGAIQSTITAPYMVPGDKLVFTIGATEAATSNFTYMIEGELQRR